MIFKILLIMCLYIVNIYVFSCPTPNTTKLEFSQHMKKFITIRTKQFRFINCCIFGAEKIEWFFKSETLEGEFLKINPQEGKYSLYNDNRTLSVKPTRKYDNGIFKCIGYKNNKILQNESMVTVVQSNEKGINIYFTSKTESFFLLHTKLTLFCLVEIYKGFNCCFKWRKAKEKKSLLYKNLNRNHLNSSLIKGYKGFSNLKYLYSDEVSNFYNFTLTLQDLKMDHEGSYICSIESRHEVDDHDFTIWIANNRMENIQKSVGAIVFLIFIVAVIYFIKNEIKILIKWTINSYFFKSENFNMYNFFFLYDFDDDDEFKKIWMIIKKLEYIGFHSYFYHRDQTYGNDISEDMVHKLNNSDIIVFWMTKKIWNNSNCISCIHTIFKNFPEKERLYVLNGNRKSLLRVCKSKAVLLDTKSCISSKVVTWNHQIFDNKRSNLYSKWCYYNLVCWLISSLPVHCMSH